jgi:aminoglycoside 3-N-acetyltransferase
MFHLIQNMFAKFPQVEIASRLIYWKWPLAHNLLKKAARHVKTPDGGAAAAPASATVNLKELHDALREMGILIGDILIVHSSMKSLSCTGATPEQVIDMLQDLVGSEGTLVMPAIPRYREALTGPERLTADLSDSIWTYDVQRTPPWTGALPHKLMKMPQARRSRFPLNGVVARGKHAHDMLARELLVADSTPCGPNSAWAYCSQYNAKILALGVDLTHSLTMIHVAEDCAENTWPIANWYRTRKFLIKDNGKEELVRVRERHPKWAIHYAERRLGADLARSGISKSSQLGSLSIALLESTSLLSYLQNRKSSGYPYYLWSFS